ncbi:MAG: DEAD/DEAH box helicase [Gemmataceae bacterium]
MSFQSFGLPVSLLVNLERLGFSTPTPIQERAIPVIQAGRDLVGTAQTGTGKTAAFLLPLLQAMLSEKRGPASTLVLTPTRELAQQIEANFRALAHGTALRSTLVIGGVAEFPQERSLRGNLDLVVATPGRLLAHLRGGRVHLRGVTRLVLDEADQMFDLGFLPDVQQVLRHLSSRKQTLLFSATFPNEVAELSRSILNEPVEVTVGTTGAAATTVSQTIYPVPLHRKTALLEHLLEQMEQPSVLVFTRTKQGARRLAQRLYDAGHQVAELHSGRTASQRTRAMQGFRERKFPILVATNIAARGVDVRHITHVINYDVSGTPEEHVHRIGRVGRGGDCGQAILFVAPEERAQMARIERRIGRLPCVKLDDFDYSLPASAASPGKSKGRATVGPVGESGLVPSGGQSKPRKARAAKVPAGKASSGYRAAESEKKPFAGKKRKSSRGQGRR